jgi:hypothetical protein
LPEVWCLKLTVFEMIVFKNVGTGARDSPAF